MTAGVGEADWVFQTTFAVPAAELKKESHELVFEGLDTFCTVFLVRSCRLRLTVRGFELIFPAPWYRTTRRSSSQRACFTRTACRSTARPSGPRATSSAWNLRALSFVARRRSVRTAESSASVRRPYVISPFAHEGAADVRRLSDYRERRLVAALCQKGAVSLRLASLMIIMLASILQADPLDFSLIGTGDRS